MRRRPARVHVLKALEWATLAFVAVFTMFPIVW